MTFPEPQQAKRIPAQASGIYNTTQVAELEEGPPTVNTLTTVTGSNEATLTSVLLTAGQYPEVSRTKRSEILSPKTLTTQWLCVPTNIH